MWLVGDECGSSHGDSLCTDGDANRNRHPNGDADSNRNADGYPNRNGNADSYSNRNGNANGYPNPYSNPDDHTHTNRDTDSIRWCDDGERVFVQLPR